MWYVTLLAHSLLLLSMFSPGFLSVIYLEYTTINQTVLSSSSTKQVWITGQFQMIFFLSRYILLTPDVRVNKRVPGRKKPPLVNIQSVLTLDSLEKYIPWLGIEPMVRVPNPSQPGSSFGFFSMLECRGLWHIYSTDRGRVCCHHLSHPNPRLWWRNQK